MAGGDDPQPRGFRLGERALRFEIEMLLPAELDRPRQTVAGLAQTVLDIAVEIHARLAMLGEDAADIDGCLEPFAGKGDACACGARTSG